MFKFLIRFWVNLSTLINLWYHGINLWSSQVNILNITKCFTILISYGLVWITYAQLSPLNIIFFIERFFLLKIWSPTIILIISRALNAYGFLVVIQLLRGSLNLCHFCFGNFRWWWSFLNQRKLSNIIIIEW